MQRRRRAWPGGQRIHPFNYLAGLMMYVLTMKQARKTLIQVVDDVCRDHEPTIIVRRRGGRGDTSLK